MHRQKSDSHNVVNPIFALLEIGLSQCWKYEDVRLIPHHDAPQIGVGAGAFAEYFDRFIIGEAEHAVLRSEVFEDSFTHAHQD